MKLIHAINRMKTEIIENKYIRIMEFVGPIVLLASVSK